MSTRVNFSNQTVWYRTSVFSGSRNFHELFDVCLGVGVNLFDIQRRAGFIPACRVADLGRVVADDDDALMSGVLEVPHFADRHHMTDVHVLARRIDTVLDAQGLLGFDGFGYTFFQLLFRDDLLNASADEVHLFVQRQHCVVLSLPVTRHMQGMNRSVICAGDE